MIQSKMILAYHKLLVCSALQKCELLNVYTVKLPILSPSLSLCLSFPVHILYNIRKVSCGQTLKTSPKTYRGILFNENYTRSQHT